MPAKCFSRDKNQKLTDFFAQAPSASVPALATTPTTTPASTTRRRPATRASKVTASHEPPTDLSVAPQMRSVSTMATRKRARSPSDSNNYSTPSFPSPKLKSPRKPAKTPQSASHCVRQPGAIYAHSNILITSPSDSSKQIVYSSQSDEAELVLPDPARRDLEKVVEGVHMWRRKAFESLKSAALRTREDAMEVDPAPCHAIHGSPTASARNTSLTLLDTNELPPLPSTPEPIDPETKTAKLIAEIKARAFATNQSSDDEQPLSFRELEDSDDGDMIDDLPLIGSTGEKRSLFSAPQTANGIFSSPLSSVPSTFNDTASGLRSRGTNDYHSPVARPMRTSRIHKLTPASRLPLTIAESSTSISAIKSVSFPSNRKKSRAVNPVHALLREKELEDKRGTSCAALRLAEEAVRQGSSETSVGSDDELGTINQLRLTDERAAWKAVRESCKSGSPVSPDDVEDFTIGDRESKMLGPVVGEAINKIFAGNKDSRGKQKAQNMDREATSGVCLWTRPSDEDMVVDSPSIPTLSGHPILACLDGFLRNGDDSLLDLTLRTGVLAVVPKGILSSNIPQLVNIALFMSSRVSDAICIALRNLWGLNPHQLQMPVAAILFALARLGANPSILKGLGVITDLAQKNSTNHETLPEAVKRLLMIVKAAGFAGAFSSDDVPNVVLILVVIGLDPLTSNELRTQLNITMDVVCNHDATDGLLHNILEKVISFARQLVPSNKALLLSFFASGSDRTRRIARHLAYRLLVSTCISPNDQAPALEPLILLLSPDIGSCGLFDVTNESTDYEELGHYVYILSVALIEIAPYVEEERANMRSTSISSVQGSPNKSKKPPVPPLEHLRRVLEVLQSKIVDTRAAHLDRSRTKAAIQRLTMRIYYDRMAFTGGRPCRRLSTLKAYFSPQRQ